MLEGIVLFYLEDKDYGYIRLPDTREEFYFRKAQLREPVAAGDRVRFVLRQGRQGYYADAISRLFIA